MDNVNLAPENNGATQEHGYLMAYDKKEQKAKGVKGIAANGELETLEAGEADKGQFIKVDQRGNFFTNFGKNFLYHYNNPGRYSLYNIPKETPVEQAKEKIEAAQLPQNEAVRKELASTRVYNNHRFNEREVNWEQAARYGITPDGLKNAKDSLERMLQGKTSAVAFRVAKDSELGRENGDAKLSLFRDENGAVKFDIHYIRQAPKVGEDYRGHTLTEDDLKTLDRTGNLGRTVDMVIDYRTKETKPCYLSKDPVTNELFHMPVEQVRVPRKVKDYTLSPSEYEAALRGEEVPIRFKSNNGNYYTTSIQMSAAERGVEFLWERSTKKMEEGQKQEQQQNSNGEQQVNGPVQTAGKSLKKEEASRQAEKKTRTRKPSITPKM
ncbi:DUF4099 domain-containing protein [Bacteroides difficilis]|uniref:DUF4099 domain-containing protein n=1 Tax=Bacteroides difficilis TaxID=2763021 RepID=UPI003AAD610E